MFCDVYKNICSKSDWRLSSTTTMLLLSLVCLSGNFWPIMAWVVLYPQYPQHVAQYDIFLFLKIRSVQKVKRCQNYHTLRMDVGYTCTLLSRRPQKILPIRGVQIFQKSRCRYLKISVHHNDDMKQVPRWGPTNIRCHHTKLSCLGDLVLRICEPLLPTVVQSLGLLYKVRKGTVEFQVDAVIVEKNYCLQTFWSHPK
jgi:hypothetical protein